MIIRSELFTQGHPPRIGQTTLSAVLENHKRKIETIKGISDPDQMTEAFLEKLSRSLVDPLVFQFDKMTRQMRTERVDASDLPANSFGARRVRFTGDYTLHLEGGN